MTTLRRNAHLPVVIAAVAALLIALTGCATPSTAGTQSESTGTPEASVLRPVELCVYNETTTPMKIQWLSSDSNDGNHDNSNRLNSGKVCGTGVDSNPNVAVQAGNVVIGTTNQILLPPVVIPAFYDESGTKICESITKSKARSGGYGFYQGDSYDYVCNNQSSITVTRTADTDLIHIQVTVHATPGYFSTVANWRYPNWTGGNDYAWDAHN